MWDHWDSRGEAAISCHDAWFGFPRAGLATARFVMQAGTTVVETLLAIAIAGLVLVIWSPHIGSSRDVRATNRAALEVASFYNRARLSAVFHGVRVRLVFAEDSLRAVIDERDSLVVAAPGPGRHGVTLEASRAVIRVGPTGLGWGAANTTLVLRRGASAESLTTSRLGRLKRWP